MPKASGSGEKWAKAVGGFANCIIADDIAGRVAYHYASAFAFGRSHFFANDEINERVNHRFDVQVGPIAFRVGSAWRAPVDALGALYRDYPQRPAVPHYTVRLEPTRPRRPA